jgi:hypothetical protein
MRWIATALVAAAFVAIPASADARWLTPREAENAIDATHYWEDGTLGTPAMPWVKIHRMSSARIYFRAWRQTSRHWIGPCPFKSCDGGPCNWTETISERVELRVYELPHEQGYRVKDTSGWSTIVRP